MRRILFTMLIALFALTLSGAAFAEEKTVEKSIALAMTLTGDEAAIGDYIHATMLVNSLRALGGEIELDGDRLILRLELGSEQLDALRKALSEEHAGLGILTEPRYQGEYSRQARSRQERMREPESHERFLLGKKQKTPCKGCKPSPESMEKEVKIIVRGDMREGKPFATKEGCCKLVVTCPKCGEHFEVDLPMPMPPMPPGEHPEIFTFRTHPDSEFAPPHPPMPDMDAMRERMGPMMERMPEMMEEMERMHQEFGDMERRLGEMERALEEFHRHMGPRDEERDREFWRAIEELHRMFKDRDREIFTALEELEYERDEEFGDLWRALDGLYEALEQLERELE